MRKKKQNDEPTERKSIALPHYIWERIEEDARNNYRTLSGQMEYNFKLIIGRQVEKIIKYFFL
jgi:macrodomain Ter protein organizer (MatP/YcbG family)